MPRKTRRPSQVTSPIQSRQQSSPWLVTALIAILAAAIGAGGTYLALRPTLQKVSILQAAADVAASAPTGASNAAPVPPLSLTEGLDPVKAALNLANWYEDQAGRSQTTGDNAGASASYAKSIANYLLAIANGLDNPDTRTDLGVAYYKSGDPKKALAEYQSAQKQNPHHENSLFNQGAAYAVLGQSSNAIAAWQAYLRRFPKGQHVADATQLIADVQAHGVPGSAAQSHPF